MSPEAMLQEAEIWENHGFGTKQAKKKKKMFTRPHPSGKKLGMVLHACHSSNNGKCKLSGLLFRPAWAKSKTLSPK
jgi:hypothetical protein